LTNDQETEWGATRTKWTEKSIVQGGAKKHQNLGVGPAQRELDKRECFHSVVKMWSGEKEKEKGKGCATGPKTVRKAKQSHPTKKRTPGPNVRDFSRKGSATFVHNRPEMSKIFPINNDEKEAKRVPETGDGHKKGEKKPFSFSSKQPPAKPG